MRTRIVGLAAVSLACLAPASAAHAQVLPSSAARSAWWGGVGLALGTGGFGVALDLSRQDERRMWRLRSATQTNEMNISLNEADRATVMELGLEVGRGQTVAGNWGALSAGAAVVSGEKGGDEFSTVGLVGTAQLISRRSPHLSVAVIANLNPRVPYVAFSGSLLLGRMPWNAR